MKQLIKSFGMYIAWMIALASFLGSLFFSQVLKLQPCELCWWQRIFMYPLVILIPIGVIRKDEHIYQYVLPLSVLGGITALYQNLLVYGILPEKAAICSYGVSCTAQVFKLLGIVTIPLMSLLAFVAIIILMLWHQSYTKRS